MNKTKLLQLCVAVLCVTGFFSCQTQQARTELNMNTDWAFFRGDTVGGERVDMNDANWIPTALPHIMQLEKKHCGGDIIYDGVGWYRRYFKVPESYKGKRVALEFEGVMTNCEVFVNGQEVARNSGGYVGFNADISDKLKWNGENNVLAVRVSAVYDSLTPPAKPQARLDFYYYSGIYRDVKMVVSDPLHITNALDKGLKNGSGIFVTYPSVSKEQAEVLVKTNLYNGRPEGESTTLRTILKDANGKEVAKEETTLEVASMTDNTIEQKLSVANPNLWHPYAPYLYTLESQLLVDGMVIDSQTDEIGIRTIKYTAEDGFFINGEKMYLIGANRHQSYPHVGDAASNSMQEREVIDMKRGGYNAVRAAHYPHDPAFLKACDKHGLLAIECVPGWQYFNSD
ncbi:MAG: glycoside hydrolase family 2 protein, partial [Tannerellaceae bacterium]